MNAWGDRLLGMLAITKEKWQRSEKGPAIAKRDPIKSMVFPGKPQNLVIDIPCTLKKC